MKILYTKKETKNLGNYENVSVEISAEDCVDIEKETPEECYLRLKEFVTIRLSEELNGKVPPKEKPISIDEVKRKILKLIDGDPNNRILIKDILKAYNANKIPDLTPEQLKEFNEKLDIL